MHKTLMDFQTFFIVVCYFPVKRTGFTRICNVLQQVEQASLTAQIFRQDVKSKVSDVIT